MDIINPEHLITAATPLIDHVIDRVKTELLPAFWDSLFSKAIEYESQIEVTVAGIPLSFRKKGQP